MNGVPPAHHITMGDDHFRKAGWEGSIAELTEVQNVGAGILDDPRQMLNRPRNSILRIFHPLQREGSGVVIEMAVPDPEGLARWGNPPQTHQGDSVSAGEQSAAKFARIGPHAADGVSSDQNVHSSSSRDEGRDS